jgi:hypothetical protein
MLPLDSVLTGACVHSFCGMQLRQSCHFSTKIELHMDVKPLASPFVLVTMVLDNQ